MDLRTSMRHSADDTLDKYPLHIVQILGFLRHIVRGYQKKQHTLSKLTYNQVRSIRAISLTYRGGRGDMEAKRLAAVTAIVEYFCLSPHGTPEDFPLSVTEAAMASRINKSPASENIYLAPLNLCSSTTALFLFTSQSVYHVASPDRNDAACSHLVCAFVEKWVRSAKSILLSAGPVWEQLSSALRVDSFSRISVLAENDL